ncbi:MAG: GTP cyclohydrolase I FolE [Elusimicrobia bacterium RIFOXYA2_FULL_50_26]|nr:MAG: GTP cyclohydrolase I FolE [Elusimicrobia bacterium RIFOXYA2_FULL_50_26]OGS22364.1 MAG: GTP cyclohydrolase I FolE [Elusimicrobia bacterium RIFOXYB2_FULL_50_12]
MDKKKLEKAVRLMLEAMGENPAREGLCATPRRVADFYEEQLSGHNVNPEDILKVYYEKEDHEEIVLVKDIPLFSLCEHHLLPFFGKAHVAYIPKSDRILGISKLVRVVELFSHRLQLQERLTKQVADTIMSVAKPHGAMVVVECEHLCMTMRGVKKQGAKMVTSAMRGIFLRDARTRAEAMSLIK